MENTFTPPLNNLHTENFTPTHQNPDASKELNDHNVIVEKFDPNAIGELHYLIGRVPTIFPELQITPSGERDSNRWITRKKFEETIARTKLSDTERNSNLLDRLETLGIIEGRIKGNQVEIIYGLSETITAAYALKSYEAPDDLLETPSTFWESLRVLIESGIQEKRSGIITQSELPSSKQGNNKKTSHGSVLKTVHPRQIQKP